MAGKNFLPLLALTGAGIFLASKVSAVNALGKLSVTGAKIKKLSINGLFKIDVQLEVTVNNPGGISVPLEYYTGTILHEGSKLADFTFNGTTTATSLIAHSQTPLQFTVGISTISVITKIINLIKGNKPNTQLAIQSNLYAGGFDLPVNFTYNLNPMAVSGIGSVKATLEFSSNSDMEKYFTNRGKKLWFSKN